MKLKVQEIIDAMPAMAVFAQKELPAKAAYRVSKLVRKMMSAHNRYKDEHADMVKSFGEQLPEGKGWRVKPENLEAFNTEHRALLDAETDLEGCVKVAWADIENLALAPAVLADLDAFIEAPAS